MVTVVLPASPRTGVEEATPGDPAGSPVSYGAFMNRLRELTGAAPAARAVLSQVADEGEPGRDAESAAAAAARGDRRQP